MKFRLAPSTIERLPQRLRILLAEPLRPNPEAYRDRSIPPRLICPSFLYFFHGRTASTGTRYSKEPGVLNSNRISRTRDRKCLSPGNFDTLRCQPRVFSARNRLSVYRCSTYNLTILSSLLFPRCPDGRTCFDQIFRVAWFPRVSDSIGQRTSVNDRGWVERGGSS